MDRKELEDILKMYRYYTVCYMQAEHAEEEECIQRKLREIEDKLLERMDKKELPKLQPSTLYELEQRIIHARKKYAKTSVLALMSEMGELADAILDNENVFDEAIDVATIALRIAEGDYEK